jgi:hypothetical protein
MASQEDGEWIADGAMEHLGGIPWHEALTPGRFHRRKPQTRGTVSGSLVEGCACGAIRCDGHSWMERNSTRKGSRKSR